MGLLIFIFYATFICQLENWIIPVQVQRLFDSFWVWFVCGAQSEYILSVKTMEKLKRHHI